MRELTPNRCTDLRYLLAGPRRSSRAISEACRLAGTAKAEDGTAATFCRALPSPSASSTALVISSTNSGMPSVRSMISCRRVAGSNLLPTTRSIMALISRSVSRLMVRAVTHGRPIQGGSNSGLNVTGSSSTRRVGTLSTIRSNNSRLVGSIPLRVLKNHQHWIRPRQRLHLSHKCLQRFLTALLGTQFERGIASRRSAATATLRSVQHLEADVELCAVGRLACRALLARCHRGQIQRRARFGRWSDKARYRCAAASRNGAIAHAARTRWLRAAPQSAATCPMPGFA